MSQAHELPEAHVLERMSQDEIDAYWLEHVYQPNARQLTLRAIVSGMFLGGILAVANMYIGLKIGWSMGMAITSTILAFALFRALHLAGIVKDELGMLENNTVASAASAAGYYSSAGLISAIPALYITTQTAMNWWQLAWWMSAVSFVGIVMAVPMRRQMIDVDRLTFPSGTACAVTIKAMHHSATEAMAKARALLYGAIFAALAEIASQLAAVGKKLNPLHWPDFGLIKLPGAIAGKKLVQYAIALPTSTLLYAAGAIMGIRVGLSIGITALVLFGVATPWLVSHGVVNLGLDSNTTYRSVLSWSVWPGVLGALAASLLHFFLKWRSIAQAFASVGKMTRAGAAQSRMAPVEVPPSWFGWGLALSTVFVSIAAKVIFDIPIWMSLVAVALSFLLAIVACRSTGETDVTPIGALGKITQLTFAGIRPGHYQTNLATASITAGAAAHSGDLLTDLKTGYLLGGSPRRQIIAQVLGIVAGAVFCVPAYRLVVGDG
ncbi:MAG TPA: OPT family oligopeptide transporter, partial [Dongiaceae bacterium]|nr:OPT family oligopeptide transporter [Dongiaceae bacterium]